MFSYVWWSFGSDRGADYLTGYGPRLLDTVGGCTAQPAARVALEE